MESDQTLTESNTWNDSAFSSCEESVARYKEIFIEPLNRLPPQHSVIPLSETIPASEQNQTLLDIMANVTRAMDESHLLSNNHSEELISFPTGDDILSFIARGVCMFGIAGNSLNLYVLTRRRLRRSMMDHMEKCAQLGLLSLAISDLILCAAHLIHSVALVGSSQMTAYTSNWHLPLLLLSVYGEGFLNWFSLSGTFLTVVVAVGRFLVVCRPLHARSLISVRGTKVALIAAWILALLFNIPRFFHYEVGDYPSCTERCPCTIKIREVGWLYSSQNKILLVYKFAYFILGVSGPLLLLVVCNACLIIALRRSKELQDTCVADDPARRRNRQISRNRITPTLICLVALFIFLVGPSEIVTFLRDERPAVTDFAGFKMAVEVTNLLQLINYAVNFILYCTVNADFRKVCIDLVSCSKCKRPKRGHKSHTTDLSDCDQTRPIHSTRNSFKEMLPCWGRRRCADDITARRESRRRLDHESSRASQTCLTTFVQKNCTNDVDDN